MYFYLYCISDNVTFWAYQLQRFLAYFGWLKVIRLSLASQLTLQAMTWPLESPDKKCHSSKNRHFTELLWASITFGKSSTIYKKMNEGMYKRKDGVLFGTLRVKQRVKRESANGWYSHPEQRCVPHVPYFDEAPITAAVDCLCVEPHALDRTGVLEIKTLKMLPCV